MAAHKLHHRIARKIRDFHRREGAFTAFAFLMVFGLGLVQVVKAHVSITPQLAELASTATQLSQQELVDDTYVVAKVSDGDTIILTNGEFVRYIGIDTPEIFPQVQCWANESTQRNKELVEGKTVRLVRDVSDRDKNGRWLRYVYVGDEFVNIDLVREGYATAVKYPPDLAHADEFSLAEKKAQALKLGRWKECQD